MKFMLSGPILLACLILQFFLPWWIIGPVAFIFALWRANSGKHAFKAGFSAVFILWFCMAIIKSFPNHNILANRVGQMFMLPDLKLNWLIMAFAAALIGGLAAGLSAFAGYFWRFLIGRDT